MLEPNSCCDEDVCLACLNLLDCPDIEVSKLGKFLLCHALGIPLSSEIGPKGLELGSDLGLSRHAIVCRKGEFDNTAQWGVSLGHHDGETGLAVAGD